MSSVRTHVKNKERCARRPGWSIVCGIAMVSADIANRHEANREKVDLRSGICRVSDGDRGEGCASLSGLAPGSANHGARSWRTGVRLLSDHMEVWELWPLCQGSFTYGQGCFAALIRQSRRGVAWRVRCRALEIGDGEGGCATGREACHVRARAISGRYSCVSGGGRSLVYQASNPAARGFFKPEYQ